MSVRWGIVIPKIEVASCTCRDWAPMEQTCGLHFGGFPADTKQLSIKEQSNQRGCQKHIFSSVWWDDTIDVMELHVLKAELGCAAVVVGLFILTRTERMEQQAREVQVFRPVWRHEAFFNSI